MKFLVNELKHQVQIINIKKTSKRTIAFNNCIFNFISNFIFFYNFSFIFFFKEEIICLLETQAFPLILSNLLKQIFEVHSLNEKYLLKVYLKFVIQGKTLMILYQYVQLLHHPLHFEVILPIIGSFFS